jgi:hypothetical protein
MTNRINNTDALSEMQRALDETPKGLSQHTVSGASVSGGSVPHSADGRQCRETDDLYKDVAILGYN